MKLKMCDRFFCLYNAGISNHTCLYNNLDLDIILHKSLQLHLSCDSSIVYHYHDFENEKIDTNIFFCNVF